MVSIFARWCHRGPMVRGILKELLLLLASSVMMTIILSSSSSSSAGLASAALIPSPNGDVGSDPVWLLDSCDQLTELRTSVTGIVILTADIICDELKVRESALLRTWAVDMYS